ncbi:hypothetical protein IGI04_001404 [Brassica rapa subsp. trilocularis]|uniref:Uncharacterized protein n=1 Tax=Brassica rapa subsp. trilocularis TaxID=1813537 RepID=A0ABQ7NSJ8_BRACM|nr:hypothetical protein IGI04_001404 [Brassica rapa subsp. trilocularis]
MSGYSKMDSTDQTPNPVDHQTRKPDPEPAEMKPRLSRNRSVAASEHPNHSPVKPAVSMMRRSSSVSSATTWPLPFIEGDDKEKVHEKKKSNNIKKKAFVKACKRFFGIS